MIDGDEYGAISGMNKWQGKLKYLEKTYPSAALSTIDSTWFDPDRHGGKPTTNHLSYGTAISLSTPVKVT
jgi:hypothetical protein